MWALPVALLGALGLAGLYVWGLATSPATQLAAKSEQLAICQRDVRLRTAREKSLRLLIARRDAAIDASPAKVQIRNWVKNPDKIPKPFNPHGQLTPPSGTQ